LVGDVHDKTVEALKQLRERNPDVTAAVLATVDGFPVHIDTAGGVDTDALAATAADIAARASRMGEDLRIGGTGEIMVRADEGYVVAARISDELCLAVTAKADSSLGLLIIGVRKLVAQLAGTA
jgi:predicted regulator of Ras-like GTPase activity (Roadblock/LC7/MglB family)